MATLGISLLAVVVAIAAAIGCQPAGRISDRRVQSAWFVLIAVIIAASPLLIPANERLARGFFALFCICLMFKVLDLYRDAQRGERPSLRQWIRFLANPVFLVRRREGLEKQPTTRANLRDLLRHGVILLLSAATFDALMRVNWVGLPFLLEHTMKSLTLFVVGISIFSVCAALFRMAGCYETDPIDRPFASRSIAEFWRRYNRWIGAALHENVFKSAGGKRHPIRGTFAAFTVSALIHEYLFGLASMGPVGAQAAFFLLQGCGVALTLRYRPHGRAAIAGMILTWSFLILSSVLFFSVAQSVVPLYQQGLPQWLNTWATASRSVFW